MMNWLWVLGLFRTGGHPAVGPWPEPGSTSDITAARIHSTRPAEAAAHGLPTLTGKSYRGTGNGVHTPVKRPVSQGEGALHAGIRMYEALLRHVRALSERTAAELKERWKVLEHATLCPNRIGGIARVPLAVNGK